MTRILVIEDDEDILENLLEVLDVGGYQAIGAPNGRIGLELAREHIPDLIVSDIMMPEMDGYTVLLEVRANSATANIPFIFLTARADRDAFRAGMAMGADDYVMKPFTAPELLDAISARLARQQALAEEARRKYEEMRGNILHMLPHELRTPLTAIIGYADMLRLDAATIRPEQISAMSERILNAGERLFRLTENFLTYAQIEIIRQDKAWMERLRKLPCREPNVLIASQANTVAQRNERETDLHLELADVTSIRIPLDSLKKIVEELVDNAFKFSREGTPVEVRSTISDGIYRLNVTNQGRGMTPEQITGIGLYVQFDRKLYEQQGTGMGLMLVTGLANIYALDFKLESVPNESLTATISIPVL